jgi:hypothetical protein
LLALFLVLVSALTALGIGARRWGGSTKEAAPSVVATQQPKNKAKPLGKGYLQRKGIWPQLRSALDAYGDRLEKPGKERMIAVGLISNTSLGMNEKVPVRLIAEFPNKLRLEKQTNGKVDTTIFDGKAKFKLGGAIKKEEEDELESLVFDSLDHFLAGQMQGQAVRHLGDRFRLDNGNDPRYTGPFYDVYQMAEFPPDTNNPKKQEVQFRRYFLNSDSHRLERISYQLEGKNGIVNVLVQLAGWQKIGGQDLPTSLTRSENGVLTLTLTISNLTLSPRTEDGIFTNPEK